MICWLGGMLTWEVDAWLLGRSQDEGLFFEGLVVRM